MTCVMHDCTSQPELQLNFEALTKMYLEMLMLCATATQRKLQPASGIVEPCCAAWLHVGFNCCALTEMYLKRMRAWSIRVSSSSSVCPLLPGRSSPSTNLAISSAGLHVEAALKCAAE